MLETDATWERERRRERRHHRSHRLSPSYVRETDFSFLLPIFVAALSLSLSRTQSSDRKSVV